MFIYSYYYVLNKYVINYVILLNDLTHQKITIKRQRYLYDTLYDIQLNHYCNMLRHLLANNILRNLSPAGILCVKCTNTYYVRNYEHF